MKRLYVLGACLAIAACAPQASAPVAPAPPPAPPVTAAPPPPMPTNIASFDGEYAGPFQLMPTGISTERLQPICTEHRRGRMSVRNGYVSLRYGNWRGHRLHYRGQVDATGAVRLLHQNAGGSYAQLTGQFQNNGFTGEMLRGLCRYAVNLVRR
jgi:hypothetical protein